MMILYTIPYTYSDIVNRRNSLNENMHADISPVLIVDSLMKAAVMAS